MNILKRGARPTVFHVTHWKAGSQWISSVLKYAAPARAFEPASVAADPLNGPVRRGRIYSPVYASRTRFRSVVADDPNHRVFFVMRDPRDTLVSWYFSLRYSHEPEWPSVQSSRNELRALSKVDGLALMIGKHMQEVIQIQREWLEAGVRVFRYEDLVANEQSVFAEIFDFCQVLAPRFYRRLVVLRHNFKVMTFGRPAKEDVTSHLRKGIVGDWKNHFDNRLKELFKAQYGQALVLAGYEKDDAW